MQVTCLTIPYMVECDMTDQEELHHILMVTFVTWMMIHVSLTDSDKINLLFGYLAILGVLTLVFWAVRLIRITIQLRKIP